MSSRGRLGPGVHSPAITAGFAFAMLAGLFLAGCDTDHMKLNTAPLKSDTETAQIAPVDSLEFQINGDEAIATELGGPLAGLTPEELKRFADGKDEFEEVETVEDGLGPVFNEAACVDLPRRPDRWHQRARRRPASASGTAAGSIRSADLGGSLIQDQAIGRGRDAATARSPSFPRSCPAGPT